MHNRIHDSVIDLAVPVYACGAGDGAPYVLNFSGQKSVRGGGVP